MERAQRTGAQAIIGAFRTVSLAIAEAEAGIRTIHQRHQVKATKLWISLQTLPEKHPVSRLPTQTFRRFTSLLQKIASAHHSQQDIETIEAFPIPPWEERIELETDASKLRSFEDSGAVLIVTSASSKGGRIGAGGAIQDTTIIDPPGGTDSITGYSITLGPREKFNTYIGELTAISIATRTLARQAQHRTILIVSCNQSALQAIKSPKHQSGQHILQEIYQAISKLRTHGNQISAIWTSSQEEMALKTRAKTAAKLGTTEGGTEIGKASSKATVLGRALQKAAKKQGLPKGTGEYTTEIDKALPGKHVKQLYNSFKHSEASILAQLRTGKARLNEYLHKIKAAETAQCTCGQATESVKHFLFRCTQWDQQRRQLFQETDSRRGCLSFFLGGRAASEQEKGWAPNMSAVRATVKYAIATGRLEWTPTNQGEGSTGNSRAE
jgi:hypothetical protein